MIQGIPPLLDRKSPKNPTLRLKGRLPIESMERWLGKGSFDGNPTIKPWGVLISNDNSTVAKGLKEAWVVMQDEIIEGMVAQDIEVPIHLLNNPVEKAGFDENCKITYKSITKQLTIEIESVRS